MTAHNAHKMIATRVQDDQLRKNLLPDLQAPGILAKWPIIGLVMFIFGGLAFGALTYNLLAQGPLLHLDQALANTLPAIALKSPPFVKVIMNAGFYMGTIVVTILVILLGVYFAYRRYWQLLAMMLIGMAGSSLLWYSLSNFFARPRPPTQIWIIVNLPGYPSGHAITAVVFYGLLAYLLVPKMPSTFWKAVVVTAAFLIMGFVGFSRIFTGGHYLTDVLAGYAVGIAWFGMAYTLIEIYFQKRRDQNVKEE
jgi:membrane-associated phospholipid phosphatase